MISWTERHPETFEAKVGAYRLHVEKMHHPYWWWKVYYKDKVLNTYPDYTTSKYKAFGLCEGLQLGHQMNSK